ncbi:DUF1993 family protein [Sphingomonas sp. 22L2VL55-3]
MLDKAEAFAAERGIEPATLIDAKLADDMLPFGYQVKACAGHSVGGSKAFAPALSRPIDRPGRPTSRVSTA